MTSNKKVLTLVEGRKVNHRTIDDMRNQTEKAGWGFSLLGEIDGNKIAKCDLEEFFSDSGLWRDLDFTMGPTESACVLNWLNSQKDKVTINTHLVGGRAFNSDKFYQYNLYGCDNLLKFCTPVAFIVKNKDDVIKKLVDGDLHFPFVFKDRMGTAGKGIELINNKEELDASKWSFGYATMAMPYIFGDKEWRVFVVGGVAVGIMSKGFEGVDPGDFEAKSAGKHKAKEEDPEVLNELCQIACHMAARCGLEYTGCDIIRDRKYGRYYALETNNSAGWQNRFNEVTGLNMGQVLLEWFDDMSVLKEKGFYEGVRTYTLNRTKYLYTANRERFAKIMDWSEDTELAEGDDLYAALQNAYRDIKNGGDVKAAKGLIDEVERRPLCWAGNFLGSDIHGEDGVFEEQCIPTAYYLAIREKYDKIQGTN